MKIPFSKGSYTAPVKKMLLPYVSISLLVAFVATSPGLQVELIGVTAKAVSWIAPQLTFESLQKAISVGNFISFLFGSTIGVVVFHSLWRARKVWQKNHRWTWWYLGLAIWFTAHMAWWGVWAVKAVLNFFNDMALPAYQAYMHLMQAIFGNWQIFGDFFVSVFVLTFSSLAINLVIKKWYYQTPHRYLRKIMSMRRKASIT